MPDVSPTLRAEVRSRAKYCCEYCLTPELVSLIGHEIDHIIAVKHGGQTLSANLSLCCALCNKHKGTDIASIDPYTSELVRLFNPRLDRWSDPFELQALQLAGQTAIGRFTATASMEPERAAERAGVDDSGWPVLLVAPTRKTRHSGGMDRRFRLPALR